MELMAGARGWFVACTLGIGASVGSAGRGEPIESSVGMWATVLGAASRGVEGRHQSMSLEDCMRKLWFSISYKRIAAAWDKYGALDEAHHGFVPN